MQKQYSFPWLILILVVGGFSQLNAQTKDQFLAAAEEYYAYGDYANAAYLFGEALEFDTLDHQVRLRRAESNLLYRAYERVLDDLAKIEAEEAAAEFPRLPYLAAKAEQPLGRYPAAKGHFDQFLQNPGNAPAAEIEDAERQRENTVWAEGVYKTYQANLEAGRAARVEPIHFSEVNTRYDDFAPYFHRDDFYFSSLRYRIAKDSIKPGRKLAKILRRNASDALTTNTPLPANVNPERLTAAHSAFNAAGNIVYYTICEYLNDTLHQRCDLYMAPVAADGKWGNGSKLSINAAGANNSTPNVGLHIDGTEYLYFASDRSGGAGMHDLYRAPLAEDGTPGAIEALDDINTAFDDVTPFYDAARRELYFSTDGRNTLGGLDVYRSSNTQEGWTQPMHLGIPTNSSYNDVYYARFANEEKGYFASNRHVAEAIFWDEEEEVCCNDIYKIDIPKICLDVTTFHALTREGLNGTNVIFYEELPTGERIELANETNANGNNYSFEVELGRKYGVMATKRGFKDDAAIIDVSLPDLVLPEGDDCIQQPLYLPPPTITLEVVTLDKRDRSPLNGVTVDLLGGDTENPPFDRFASDTKPDSNRYFYDITVQRFYGVFGSKEGYLPDSAFADTRGMSLTRDTTIFRELLLEPALPDPCTNEPTVYFHNDRPVKGTPHTTTPANYMRTYERYVETYKPSYYSRWVNAGRESKAEMDAFFVTVDQGAENLHQFAAMLEDYLAGGGNIVVTLQGFASPLSNGPYNKKLSARRCISVINYLEAYNGGVLKNYLDDSVILMFKDASFAVPSSYDGIPVRSYSTPTPEIPGDKALVFDIKPNGETDSTGAKATGAASVYSTAAGRARYVEVKVFGCPQSTDTDQ